VLNGLLLLLLLLLSCNLYIYYVMYNNVNGLLVILLLIYEVERKKYELRSTALITRMWAPPMSNVMAALPNIGGALCSTPQSLADAHYYSAACSNASKTRNHLKLAGVPKLTKRSQPLVGRSSTYCGDMWGRYCDLTSFSDCRYVP